MHERGVCVIVNPIDVLHQFPVRKTPKQKQAFRDAVLAYAQNIGYGCTVEKGAFDCRNVVIGNPDSAYYLVTAHYDTCAVMPFPNFITPCNVAVYMLCQLALYLTVAAAAGVTGGILGFVSGSPLLGKILAVLFALTILGLLVLGPANKNNANDNTSGVVTLLEVARSIPQNQRSKVCFVLFDLEEAGLIGSSSYRKAHRKVTDRQIVLNLDCVGEGDEILLFPTKYLKKNMTKLKQIYFSCGYFGNKSLLVWDRGPSFYPSDQMCFPYGVGIAALKRSKYGLYLSKIHTSADANLDITNVNILRAALVSMICCSAVKKG